VFLPQHGAISIPGRRVHYQPRRLVKHYDVLIFIDHWQIKWFRLEAVDAIIDQLVGRL